MANYTVRIELHDATWDDYQELHEKMADAGYRRTIIGRDGVEYDLPDAEYNLPGSSKTRIEVRDQALAIAKKVKAAPRPGVLVTEGARTWILDPVE